MTRLNSCRSVAVLQLIVQSSQPTAASFSSISRRTRSSPGTVVFASRSFFGASSTAGSFQNARNNNNVGLRRKFSYPNLSVKASIRGDNLERDSSSDSNPLPIQNPSEAVFSALDPMRTYVVQLKGVSARNKGAGVGIIMYDADNNERISKLRKYLEEDRTLFESEYCAIIIGMQHAMQRGALKIVLRIDNDVIANQLGGVYPVSKPSLKNLYWKIMEYKESLAEFSIERVREKDNMEARDLATDALATSKSINIDDIRGSTENIDSDGNIEVQRNRPTSESIGGADAGNTREKPVVDSNDQGESDTNLLTKQGWTNLLTKQGKSDTATDIDSSKTYLLRFDGGARGNPHGIAGAGMVLYDDTGTEIWCGWKFLAKHMSNNLAEYWAILLGLRSASSLGIRKIRAEGDSELIVKQLNGIYRVKDAKLKCLWSEAKSAMDGFESIDVSHIYRAENKRADWLANHAMDTETSYGFDDESSS